MRPVFNLAAGVVAAVVIVVFWRPVVDGAGHAPADTPPIAGCHEVPSSELYVQQTYACDDGSRVVVFATDAARDDYLAVAEHFGAATLGVGRRWAHVLVTDE